MQTSTVRVALVTVAVLAATVAARQGHAFCRATTVAPPPDFSADTGCWDQGKPLFWRNACVGFSVQSSDGKKMKAADVGSVLGLAFGAWTSAACAGGGRPSIDVKQLASTTVNTVEYNSGAQNVNLVVMRDDKWPHPQGESLALTTLSFDADTGEIFDADIEINTADNTFATADPVPADGYDLRSILTHQAGHFLGLAHSAEPASTMFASYAPGSTDDRAARPDDVSGICAVYAPGGARATAAGPVNAATCDTTPRGGLELAPPPPASKKGCASARSSFASSASTAALAALTGVVLLGFRRRARRTGRR